MKNKNYLDKIIDFIFSKSNIKYLILLVLIGFILRAFISTSIAPNADEMLHAPHAINFINSGKLQIMDQDPIWFFLTDLSYKIFGVSLFSARFLAVLFGSLSIIVLYLLTSLLYNKKLALISSILLTFSSFHISMSLAEMDVAMVFFVLLSLFFFVKSLKEKNERLLILCYVFLGIAVLVKQIAITFIPVLIISYIYYKLKNKEKLNFKPLIHFIITMLIISLPVLTFNYLLYQDRGLVDLQFSRFLGIAKETYVPIEATLKPFRFHDIFFSYDDQMPGFLSGLSFFYNFDKLIFILGVLGFIVALSKKREFLLLISLSFLFPFLFLAGTSLLEYHFIFGMPLLSIFTGIFIYFLAEKLSKFKLKTNVMLGILILTIIIFNLFFIVNRGAFSGVNEITKLMSYSKDNIEDNSLVIVDSRTYRGRIAFSFNDKHYLESNFLNDLTNAQSQLHGSPIKISTYFIECIIDDCGWGTINSQPEFNASAENSVEFFKNNSRHLSTITTNRGVPYFNVYQTNLLLKPTSLQLVDSTHEWFYYPLRYIPKEKIFDDYNANGFNKVLDIIAHIILYLEVLIAILAIFLIFYLLTKSESEKNETQHNNAGI